MNRLLPRFTVVPALMVLLALPGVARAQYAELTLAATNPDASHVQLDVRYTDSPDTPSYPNIAGFVVTRQSLQDCSAPATITVTPIPRTGSDTRFSLVDIPPASAESFKYLVRPVDANGNGVSIHRGMNYVVDWAIAGAPAFSAPATIGTLQDWGWTLAVVPCAGSCWPALYLTNGFDPWAGVDDLRPYIGNTMAVYGTVGDGSVEGAYLILHHATSGTCEQVVETHRTSWGSLKMLYR